MASSRKRLGELLVEAGAIDQMQLQAALGYQRQWGGKLGSTLVERGFISEPRLVEVLAAQLRVPVVQITKTRVDARALNIVPVATAEQLRIFPLELKGSDKSETLVVAMSDPTDLAAIDQLQFRTRKRIQSVLAGDKDITSAIRRHYHGEDAPAPEDARSGAKPAPPPASAANMGDAHMLSGEDDYVPGLVAWGEGEVKRPGSHSQVPRPPVQPPPQQVYPPQYYAPQGPPQPPPYSGVAAYQPVPNGQGMGVPMGMPPGFSQDARGRPMLAPQGAPAPRAPMSPPAYAGLDPFADIEPELHDPLAGLDPTEVSGHHSQVDAIDFSDIDPLAGTSPDSWATDIEPVRASLGPGDPLGGHDALGQHDPLGYHDPLGAALDAFPSIPATALPTDEADDLEEVDVEALEEEAEQHDPSWRRGTRKTEKAVDAAAEGWLTPAEEPDAWNTPSESDAQPQDPWQTMSEGSASTSLPPAAPREAPATWETAAEPVPGVASNELPEDEWLERAAHAPVPDPEPVDTSWLEPVAATTGIEPAPSPAVESSLELETDSEAPATEAVSDAWGGDAWEAVPETPAEHEPWQPTEETAAPLAAEDLDAAPASSEAWSGDAWSAREAPVDESASLPLEDAALSHDFETPAEPSQASAEPPAVDGATPEQSVEAAWGEPLDVVDVAVPAAAWNEQPAVAPTPEEALADWVSGDAADPAQPVASEAAGDWSGVLPAEEPPVAVDEAEALGWDTPTEASAPVETALPEWSAPVAVETAHEEPAPAWSEADAAATLIATDDEAATWADPEAPGALDGVTSDTIEDENAAAAWAGTSDAEPDADVPVEVDENAAVLWAADDATVEPPVEAGSLDPAEEDAATAWAKDSAEEPPQSAEPDAAGGAATEAQASALAQEVAEPPLSGRDAEHRSTDVEIDRALPAEVEADAGEFPPPAEAVAPEPAAAEPPPAVVEAAASVAVDDEWAGFGFIEPPPEAPDATQTLIVAPEDIQRTQPDELPPVVPSLVLPAEQPARVVSQRGWALVGLERPTPEDAVRVVGVLLEMLVSSGKLDVAAFQTALRESEERSRS
jgi:hypothetical protein